MLCCDITGEVCECVSNYRKVEFLRAAFLGSGLLGEFTLEPSGESDSSAGECSRLRPTR